MDVVTHDTDGDGFMDENDCYGMLAQNVVGMVLYQSSGETLIGKDADDFWTYSADTERSVNTMLRVAELLQTNTDYVYLSEDWRNMLAMFESNQGLFCIKI